MCEHFEGILKILSQVRSLLVSLPGTDAGAVKTSGVLGLLPEEEEGEEEGEGKEELGRVLYDSCVVLIQHIMSRQPCVAAITGGASPCSKEKVSKEVGIKLIVVDPRSPPMKPWLIKVL